MGTILFWIRDHLLLAGIIGTCLLFLTLLVGAVSHLADTFTLPAAPTSGQQQSRRAFLHLLRNEYRRQMADSLQGCAGYFGYPFQNQGKNSECDTISPVLAISVIRSNMRKKIVCKEPSHHHLDL